LAKRAFTVISTLMCVFTLFSYAHSAENKNILKFIGTLHPRKDTIIESAISSTVIQTLVKEGDNVKKDQILLKMDAQEQEAELKLAEIALQHENIEYEKALSKFENAKEMHKRGSTTTEEMKNAEREAKITELSVKKAKITLEKVKKKYEAAVVSSPFDGTIVEISKNSGDSVKTGEKLLRINDSYELILIAILDSQYYGKIKKGTEITFTTEYTSGTFRTQIRRVVPYSSEGDNFKIIAIVPNAALKLLPGTQVTCFGRLR